MAFLIVLLNFVIRKYPYLLIIASILLSFSLVKSVWIVSFCIGWQVISVEVHRAARQRRWTVYMIRLDQARAQDTVRYLIASLYNWRKVVQRSCLQTKNSKVDNLQLAVVSRGWFHQIYVSCNLVLTGHEVTSYALLNILYH